jgi:hypothetical protein
MLKTNPFRFFNGFKPLIFSEVLCGKKVWTLSTSIAGFIGVYPQLSAIEKAIKPLF